MASLADLKKRIHNTPNRQAQCYIRAYNGASYEFVNAGRITGTNVTIDEVAGDMDQDGREDSEMHDVTVSFTLQQASNKELSIIPDFVRPTPEDQFENGHVLYFTGSKISTSEVNNNLDSDLPDYTVFGDTSSEPSDPEGLVFVDAILKVTGEMDLTGGDSVITLEFTMRIRNSEFSDFDDETATDGNHIVISVN